MGADGLGFRFEVAVALKILRVDGGPAGDLRVGEGLAVLAYRGQDGEDPLSALFAVGTTPLNGGRPAGIEDLDPSGGDGPQPEGADLGGLLLPAPAGDGPGPVGQRIVNTDCSPYPRECSASGGRVAQPVVVPEVRLRSCCALGCAMVCARR
ncbi:hypothetical protein [Streptomyces sp. NPDC057238]|uniref:hypothetical protein n=1 Tax=Streptomyces sp. NPDC057238 TaxID=3346060 RepID=UPI00362C9546